ncbi:DUF3372 domain-containing protein [Inhella sp. 1Y17]|uniref:DUF3372 domain-containing protein n=2 Tax=Inhella proteolytica TaxID=2795029 RepID=A0A931NF92_9BURK|nr:DUF3372 domain-containing protein [Inhella proteolytica]
MRVNEIVGGLWLMASVAALAQPDLQACEDSAPWAHTQEVAARPAGDARAHWLDAQRLWWPGTGGAARFELQHQGQAVLELQRDAEAWPAELQARTRHLGAGQALRLPTGWGPERARELLRGELQLVLRDAQGQELARSRVQTPLAIDALFPVASARSYGVSLSAHATAGRLWAPSARRVEVCLYPGAQAAAARRLEAQWEPESGSWQWQLPERLGRGWTYRYLVEVWVPGQGWVRQRVTDPYSVSLTADSARSAVLDLDDPATQPPGWAAAQHQPRPAKALHELVIYELHVRDFSLQDARVPLAERGRYLGFTHPRSHGMQHLRQLARAGVTDVHLLPVFDLATVPEQGCVQPVVPAAAPDSPAQQGAVMAVSAQDCFNWGYDPFHFNAPEGSFASDAMDPAVRVREFRAMVLALQRAGLRVGMDMVYNHTAATGPHPKSVLDRIVPGYYQRLNAVGEVERSTCCDNTATEHRMMAKLMSDSVLLWARAYRLDSFRFDLMGHQPRAEMLALRQRLRRELGREIQFIGEGWNFGEVANGARFVQASQLSLAGDGIGTFSDRARDAARGGSFGAVAEIMRSRGWVHGLDDEAARRAASLLRLGLGGTLQDLQVPDAAGVLRRGAEIDYGGQPAGYAGQPGEAVAYVENHDNHTLFDAHVLKLPLGTPMAERVQVQTLASALALWSQGVAYVHAGQELLRSKSLDRNSYDSGDWFNRLDYSLQDNGFAAGLPPKPDNGADWEALAPLLRDPSAKPTPADIRQARDQFLDLLRIRASSSLFRIGSATELQRRLRFPAVPAGQEGRLIVVDLDGRDWPGARFAGLRLVFNAGVDAAELADDSGWRPHPVHRRPEAGDRRVALEASRAPAGRLRVPPRSAVAFVR